MSEKTDCEWRADAAGNFFTTGCGRTISTALGLPNPGDYCGGCGRLIELVSVAELHRSYHVEWPE